MVSVLDALAGPACYTKYSDVDTYFPMLHHVQVFLKMEGKNVTPSVPDLFLSKNHGVSCSYGFGLYLRKGSIKYVFYICHRINRY